MKVSLEFPLHIGEAQAIQLVWELVLPLLIEETVGRWVARGLGIPISGIAGQIITAFRRRIITAQEACNKRLELFQVGRINREIYEALPGYHTLSRTRAWSRRAEAHGSCPALDE